MAVYLDFGVYSGFEKDWQLIYKAELILEETVSDKHGHLFILLFCIKMSHKEDTGTGIWRRRIISVMEDYMHILTDIYFVLVLTWCIYEKQDWPFWNNICGDSHILKSFGKTGQISIFHITARVSHCLRSTLCSDLWHEQGVTACPRPDRIGGCQ